MLDLIGQLNREHLAGRDFDDRLAARVNAYELAFRMQSAAPEIVDISRETEATRRLYGIGQKETNEFGTRCLLARRMVEKGVRFVQLYSGDTGGWDAHKDVLKNHSKYCRRTDLPIAGLLKDLKTRGMLDDTLVIWGGEFGRMPMSEQGTGRDHNPWGYSVWLAGAGVRGGMAYGATDPVGLRRRAKQGARARPSRDDSTFTRHQPRTPDHLPQWPRRAPHRRRRERCHRHSRVMFLRCVSLLLLSLSLGQAEESATIAEPPITTADREHWSWRPLGQAAIPRVKVTGRLANQVDHFIAEKLEGKNLTLVPEADRRTLIRRLYFDLLGLPPTAEAVVEFEADARPDAYERLVESLLASPAFGERWAQHWLDLARFAETDGFEHDKVRPNAWRYRDWLISALNADQSYDEFVLHQLAGDEVSPAAALATGFLLAGQDMPDLNLTTERRHMVLNEMTTTVGSVFLRPDRRLRAVPRPQVEPGQPGRFLSVARVLRERPAIQGTETCPCRG